MSFVEARHDPMFRLVFVFQLANVFVAFQMLLCLLLWFVVRIDPSLVLFACRRLASGRVSRSDCILGDM